MTTDTLDINNLGLATETLDAVDVAAAEAANSYAPTITPGYHEFIFALEDEDAVKKNETGKSAGSYTIRYLGTIAEGGPFDGREVRFNRVSTYRSEKMKNSRAGELLFALGLTERFNATAHSVKDMVELLQEATGSQAKFRGQVIWRAYDKDSGLTISTSPGKAWTDGEGKEHAAELAWPKRTDGTYEPRPDFPNGNPAQGREEIARTSPVRAAAATK